MSWNDALRLTKDEARRHRQNSQRGSGYQRKDRDEDSSVPLAVVLNYSHAPSS